jgi:hypothetical protein
MSRSRRGVRIVVVLAVWMVLGAACAGAETGRVVVVPKVALVLWQGVVAHFQGFLLGEPSRKACAPATEGTTVIDPFGCPRTAEPPSASTTEDGTQIDPWG